MTSEIIHSILQMIGAFSVLYFIQNQTLNIIDLIKQKYEANKCK
jgi:hypothetical protein